MKPSRRKRYRILTAAAELVSLWYGQKANEPFKKNDPAAERSYTHSSVIHDRDYFALWDACRRLGREFEFMWSSPEYDTPGSQSYWDYVQEHGKVLTEEELQSLLDGTLDLPQVEGPKCVDPLDAHVIKAADVSRASVPQIGRLIYCFQGADKFNDGLWDGFVSSGELEQAILRIEVLLKAGTDLSGDGAPPVKG